MPGMIGSGLEVGGVFALVGSAADAVEDFLKPDITTEKQRALFAIYRKLLLKARVDQIEEWLTNSRDQHQFDTIGCFANIYKKLGTTDLQSQLIRAVFPQFTDTIITEAATIDQYCLLCHTALSSKSSEKEEISASDNLNKLIELLGDKNFNFFKTGQDVLFFLKSTPSMVRAYLSAILIQKEKEKELPTNGGRLFSLYIQYYDLIGMFIPKWNELSSTDRYKEFRSKVSIIEQENITESNVFFKVWAVATSIWEMSFKRQGTSAETEYDKHVLAEASQGVYSPLIRDFLRFADVIDVDLDKLTIISDLIKGIVDVKREEVGKYFIKQLTNAKTSPLISSADRQKFFEQRGPKSYGPVSLQLTDDQGDKELQVQENKGKKGKRKDKDNDFVMPALATSSSFLSLGGISKSLEELDDLIVRASLPSIDTVSPTDETRSRTLSSTSSGKISIQNEGDSNGVIIQQDINILFETLKENTARVQEVLREAEENTARAQEMLRQVRERTTSVMVSNVRMQHYKEEGENGETRIKTREQKALARELHYQNEKRKELKLEPLTIDEAKKLGLAYPKINDQSLSSSLSTVEEARSVNQDLGFTEAGLPKSQVFTAEAIPMNCEITTSVVPKVNPDLERRYGKFLGNVTRASSDQEKKEKFIELIENYIRPMLFGLWKINCGPVGSKVLRIMTGSWGRTTANLALAEQVLKVAKERLVNSTRTSLTLNGTTIMVLPPLPEETFDVFKKAVWDDVVRDAITTEGNAIKNSATSSSLFRRIKYIEENFAVSCDYSRGSAKRS